MESFLLDVKNTYQKEVQMVEMEVQVGILFCVLMNKTIHYKNIASKELSKPNLAKMAWAAYAMENLPKLYI